MRPSLRFRFGQLLMLLKQRSRALDAFRKAARATPDHPQAWSCIGFLLAERADLAGAIDAFARALELEPGSAAAHFNLGFLLQRAGRHDEARARFARALEIDPKLERARLGLARSQSLKASRGEYPSS
jgi:tetratricopeptide (TPR) repeat protein